MLGKQIDIMTVSLRPTSAGHSSRLCGDKYGGMKEGNELLISVGVIVLFTVLAFYTLESY